MKRCEYGQRVMNTEVPPQSIRNFAWTPAPPLAPRFRTACHHPLTRCSMPCRAMLLGIRQNARLYSLLRAVKKMCGIVRLQPVDSFPVMRSLYGCQISVCVRGCRAFSFFVAQHIDKKWQRMSVIFIFFCVIFFVSLLKNISLYLIPRWSVVVGNENEISL